MSYDLCLFDLDGTLIDPKVGTTKAYQFALRAFNIYKELNELTKYIGPPLRDIFKENGLDENDVEIAVSKFREYLSETGIYESIEYQGISDFLQDLKENNKTLAVVTNKFKLFADQTLDHFNLQRYFSYVAGDSIDGSLTINGKRDLISITLSKLDPAREKSAVMIGDRKHDIIGAREAGINSIGILWGYGSQEELEQAEPTHIAETMNDLRNILLSKLI